jgi:hypothetical protein
VRDARCWAAGFARPKWPEVEVLSIFLIYFPEANFDAYFDNFRFKFDANFCANFLSNDIICSDNSKVIKVLLENIMRMLKVFPLRT